MSKIAKKLHYRKASTVTDISLYDNTANVGSNYITLKVDSANAYAQLVAPGSAGSTDLRVRKASTVYAVASSTQDTTMLTGVTDNGSNVQMPAITSASYWGAGANAAWSEGGVTWYHNLTWPAPSSVLCMFTVSMTAHVTLADHFRLRYGTSTSCVTDGGVFSGTSRATPGMAAGTYYFRVDAEDAANTVIYSSAVYGGVANTYNIANSTGYINFHLHGGAAGTQTVNRRWECGTNAATWTVPAGVYQISVDMIGGGGGGGGASLCYRPTTGGGGGSGYAGIDLQVGVTPGEVLTAYIGAGGGGAGIDWAGAQPDRSVGRGADGGATSLYRGGTALLVVGGGQGANQEDWGHPEWSTQSGQDHSITSYGKGGVNGTTGTTSSSRFEDKSFPGGMGGVDNRFGWYGKGGNGTFMALNAPGQGFVASKYQCSAGAQAGAQGLLVINWMEQGYTGEAVAINGTGKNFVRIVGQTAKRAMYAWAHSDHGYSGGNSDSPTGWIWADNCTCNCNYCVCNCNFCSCNCNYCACNCNYSPCSCSSGGN